MELVFICFAVISTSVLGGLCLLVLEYQNAKSRRWTREWSTPTMPSPPPPSLPRKQAPVSKGAA